VSVFTDEFVPYGPGRKAAIRGLKIEDLGERMRGYRRAVARRYSIIKPERIVRDLGTDEKLWISTKVDGELWFLVKHAGEVALCAYNGRVLQGIPVVDEAEKLLAGVDNVLMAGELFSLAGDGRPRVHNVAFALGDGGLAKTLGFKAFDLLSDGETDWVGSSYEDKYARMGVLLAGGKRCAMVTTVEGNGEAVVGCWQDWVATKKAEGLVVRAAGGQVYKIKPTVTIDVVIVAFGERTSGELSQVREFTVALVRDDGTHQILGTVSGGLSDADRVEWHRRLSAAEVPSAFRMPNSEGTLCRFVRPEIVLELKCSDLIDRSAGDRQVRRMAVRYDPSSGYEAVGAMPIVAMIHPVIVRERDDKDPDTIGVGLDQVYAVVPFDARHESASTQELPAAEVVDRKVYLKSTKTSPMVRKYVAIATNKREMDPRFPHFVLYTTDFSPNRADALKTKVEVASTRERLDAAIERWVTANIKRGWNPADA
jgi:hypothetical protein